MSTQGLAPTGSEDLPLLVGVQDTPAAATVRAFEVARPALEGMVAAFRAFEEIAASAAERFPTHITIANIAREARTILTAVEGTLQSGMAAHIEQYQGFVIEGLQRVHQCFCVEFFEEDHARVVYPTLATSFNALLRQAFALINTEGVAFLDPEAARLLPAIVVPETAEAPEIAATSGNIEARAAEAQRSPEETLAHENLRTMEAAIETAYRQIPAHVLNSHNARLLRERLTGYRARVQALNETPSLSMRAVHDLLYDFSNDFDSLRGDSRENCRFFADMRATSVVRAEGGQREYRFPRYALDIRRTLTGAIESIFGDEPVETTAHRPDTFETESATAVEIAQLAPTLAAAVQAVEAKNPTTHIDEPAALAYRAAEAAHFAVRQIGPFLDQLSSLNDLALAEANRTSEEALSVARYHAEMAARYARVADLVRQAVTATPEMRAPLIGNLREALGETPSLSDSFADALERRLASDASFEEAQQLLQGLATQAAEFAQSESDRAKHYVDLGARAVDAIHEDARLSPSYVPVEEMFLGAATLPTGNSPEAIAERRRLASQPAAVQANDPTGVEPEVEAPEPAPVPEQQPPAAINMMAALARSTVVNGNGPTLISSDMDELTTAPERAAAEQARFNELSKPGRDFGTHPAAAFAPSPVEGPAVHAPEAGPTPATVETAQAGVFARLSGWLGRNARALGIAAVVATGFGTLGAVGVYAANYSKGSTDAANSPDVPAEMAAAQAPTVAGGTTQGLQAPEQAPSAPVVGPTEVAAVPSAAVASNPVGHNSGAQPSAPAKTVFETVAQQSPNATPAQVAAHVNTGLAAHADDVQQMSAAFDGAHVNSPEWFGDVKKDLLSKPGFKGAFGLDPDSPNLAPLANAKTAGEYFATAKRLGVGDHMSRMMLGQIGAYGLDAKEVGSIAKMILAK